MLFKQLRTLEFLKHVVLRIEDFEYCVDLLLKVANFLISTIKGMLVNLASLESELIDEYVAEPS
jgi:hypothetical protein